MDKTKEEFYCEKYNNFLKYIKEHVLPLSPELENFYTEYKYLTYDELVEYSIKYLKPLSNFQNSHQLFENFTRKTLQDYNVVASDDIISKLVRYFSFFSTI